MMVSSALIFACMCVSAAAPAFAPGDVPNEYVVDTGKITGKLGAGGQSNGLAPLVYADGGVEMASPIGLLNYYRVFSTNHRYVESMRGLPSETRLEGPDTVRVHWPAVDGRPYALTGIYHWLAPDTLELETRVEAMDTLPNFEVFLSSYLTPPFPVSSVYAKSKEGGNRFMTAEVENGLWQVFPRDAAALALVKDGRWTIEPSPVDWAVPAEYAAPLVYRRHKDSNLTVALMGRSEECFAVFTPQRGESHTSMYFSLFGRTLKPGETATAKVRLVIGTFDDKALEERYQAFVNGRQK